jgi:hypothetical protein
VELTLGIVLRGMVSVLVWASVRAGARRRCALLTRRGLQRQRLLGGRIAMLVLWSAAVVHAQQKPANKPSEPLPHRPVTRIGLVVHAVYDKGQPVVSAAWLRPRVAHANRLFGPIGVEFIVREAGAEDAAFADLRTRDQRDALGRGKTPPGAIHVFVVRRLADVDAPGEVIRGVHWRDRSRSGERWIILSSIAPKLVLAHELGHYFGLPHSKDGRSLMNKQKGGGRPPWSSRTFVESEYQTLALQRDQMLATGWLRPVTAQDDAPRPATP